MNRIAPLLAFTVVFLLPAVAFAQAEAVMDDTTAAGEALTWVVNIAATTLALLINWLVLKGIKYFEKKTKIDIPAAQEELLMKLAEKGIGLAEEKAHQAVKKGATKLEGPEKLEVALKFVAKMAKEYKLPEMAEDKLADYVEAKLGLAR